MRIFIKLKALKTVYQDKSINSRFHLGTQGYLYNKLKESNFYNIHDKKSYKPFCFSGIFPVFNQRIEEEYNYSLIISSPKKELIDFFMLNIITGEKVNFGEYFFEIIDLKVEKDILKNFDMLETTNMVSITKKNEKGRPYSINFSKNEKEFLDYLRKNCIKKYNYYNNEDLPLDYDIFGKSIIKLKENSKEIISIKMPESQKEKGFTIMGCPIEIKLSHLTKIQRDILNCVYDAGFGEKNSYGIGFMKKKTRFSLNDLNNFEKLI